MSSGEVEALEEELKALVVASVDLTRGLSTITTRMQVVKSRLDEIRLKCTNTTNRDERVTRDGRDDTDAGEVVTNNNKRVERATSPINFRHSNASNSYTRGTSISPSRINIVQQQQLNQERLFKTENEICMQEDFDNLEDAADSDARSNVTNQALQV